MGLWIVALLSMEVSNLKQFLLRIAVFFVIVAILDCAIGKVFYYLHANIAGGRSGAEYYACKESNEDILIMGSSRASHHYVPDIITERIGMSCFNVGQDGNGIVLQYGRWKMVSERYTPKMIIYDISNSYDLLINDNMAYIDRLKPFCDDKVVRKYVSGLFPLESIKLLSHLYRYNYKFLELLSDCARNGDYREMSGYLPLMGCIREDVAKEKCNLPKEQSMEYDYVKYDLLEQLLVEAEEKGTKVVFVISPSWAGGEYESGAYSKLSDLAEKHGIPFLTFFDSEICFRQDYFKDSSHLNDEGARAFTKELISKLSN